MSERQQIMHVILWTNGTVACFDQHGEQMPDYQGHYGEVKDKILREYRGKWQLAEWNKGVLATFRPSLYLSEEGE